MPAGRKSHRREILDENPAQPAMRAGFLAARHLAEYPNPLETRRL